MHLTAFAEEVRRLDNQRTLDKITANGSERFNATRWLRHKEGQLVGSGYIVKYLAETSPGLHNDRFTIKGD